MESQMSKEFIIITVEINISVIIKMEKKKEKALIIGMMVVDI